MGIFAMGILLAFIALAYAKDTQVSSIRTPGGLVGSIDKLVDQLVNKLFDRTLKVPPKCHKDLDRTTIGKPDAAFEDYQKIEWPRNRRLFEDYRKLDEGTQNAQDTQDVNMDEGDQKYGRPVDIRYDSEKLAGLKSFDLSRLDHWQAENIKELEKMEAGRNKTREEAAKFRGPGHVLWDMQQVLRNDTEAGIPNSNWDKNGTDSTGIRRVGKGHQRDPAGRHLNNWLFGPGYNPDLDLRPALRKQVEYYFSDENLEYDKFFHDLISKDPDGWVDMEYVIQCKKMRNVLRDHADSEDFVLEALKDSHLETRNTTEECGIRRPGNKALPELKERPTPPPGHDKPLWMISDEDWMNLYNIDPYHGKGRPDTKEEIREWRKKNFNRFSGGSLIPSFDPGLKKGFREEENEAKREAPEMAKKLGFDIPKHGDYNINALYRNVLGECSP